MQTASKKQEDLKIDFRSWAPLPKGADSHIAACAEFNVGFEPLKPHWDGKLDRVYALRVAVIDKPGELPALKLDGSCCLADLPSDIKAEIARLCLERYSADLLARAEKENA